MSSSDNIKVLERALSIAKKMALPHAKNIDFRANLIGETSIESDDIMLLEKALVIAKKSRVTSGDTCISKSPSNSSTNMTDYNSGLSTGLSEVHCQDMSTQTEETECTCGEKDADERSTAM